MKIGDWLILAGGLSLFLYGMRLMGEGLSGLSQGRLERVLTRLTDSPLKGLLAGAGVTALVQSSSLVTVMVVGLVDSGVLQLGQAAGVILGANVGTTVTSWILCLAGSGASPGGSGIEGSDIGGWGIRGGGILRVTYLAVPAVACVWILRRICGNRSRSSEKNGGGGAISVTVGLILLFLGMDAMGTGARPLASVPEFVGILISFSEPASGVLAGAAVTAALQSSSASVGILQALCETGTVNYGMAIPIIMGQNIGTCVTAMLSAVGAGRNAKRAALIHLYFNLIGAGVFLLLFGVARGISAPELWERAVDARGIAVLHSAFNILSAMMILPFLDGLVRLACANPLRCFLDRKRCGWYSEYKGNIR
ncbi:MAG: Na/Pi symporter [Clostridium sp.]|nr:Na/Pi symporter [Acetatifactor muris]MCM1527051.1 Na/Pi symporter [Bacteroides sp.]MCM1562028.1 Na/Pi symporter [Clostridium sp.]